MTHFQEQIELMIEEKRSQGYLPEELTYPLSNRLYWWQSPTYNNEKLHYENADMRIVQWCNVIELREGPAAEQKFLDDLASMIRDAVEYKTEIEAQEGQEVLNFERVIGNASVETTEHLRHIS